MEPIIKNKVRILRPYEVNQLLRGIPKFEHQLLFKSLLYSGGRYIELQRLKENPDWFDNNFIHLPSLKKEARQKERWVHLSSRGKEVIATYVNSPYILPTKETWNENIKRWANNVSLDSVGLSAKTTRKTMESWLCWYYPEKMNLIFLSQGHIDNVALSHYLNMPFTKEDKSLMNEYINGWE